MKTLWNDSDRREIQSRIERLSPDAPAKWGKMDAPRAVAHLTDAMRMALGDLACKRKNVPIGYPPLKQLIVYWLPWPEGAPTAPELISRVPASWTGEITELTALIKRFGKQDRNRTWPEHPAFGRLSSRAWGRLTYRHVDHHLRQFGA
jgi:hypothetical protein